MSHMSFIKFPLLDIHFRHKIIIKFNLRRVNFSYKIAKYAETHCLFYEAFLGNNTLFLN